jgi:tetrapyrrole methylase family protein / MazG family protein
MMATNIIVVGLGPGSWGQVTGEARDILNKTSAERLYLRTSQHPTVDNLPRSLRENCHSFGALFENSPTFEAVQTEIAAQLIAAARNGSGMPIVYAVPGHPLIGEASVKRLLNRAQIIGIEVRIVAGISFIEPVCAALGFDPLLAGLQIVDSAQLAAELEIGPGDRDRDFYFSSFSVPFSGSKLPTLLALSPNLPLLLSQVFNTAVASMVQTGLLELYPAPHPVSLVRAAGSDGQQVLEVPLGELAARGEAMFSPLTCLYVPPLPALAATRSLDTLIYITGRLQGPNGCPWDREQTHQSIKQNLIEETYEAVDALDALAADATGEYLAENLDKFAEELGDVLLQVVFQSQMATINGEFTLGDVARHVSSKLMRRHPHVFGDVQVSGSGEVLQNWEEIKKAERAGKVKASSEPRLEMSEGLKGVSRQLPALHYAQEVQGRVARVGFDWPNIEGVLDKVREEVAEIAAADATHKREEFGDLLFAIVNLGRWLGLDVEEALRLANQKFIRRFAALEGKAVTQGRQLKDMTLDEMDALWNEVKGEEPKD